MAAELIAFVGGGQMAGSLIGGLLAAGHPAARLRVAEPDATRATALRGSHGIEVRASAREVADGCDALVLAVKPQVMLEALAGLAPTASTTVVSIAAGIRVDTLRAWLGPDAPIIRSMPNTPALLRCGVTGLHAPAGTPEASRQLAERILGAVGHTCWVADESLLDAITAVSGSGPAYYFLLTEALRDAGVALGLDASVAKLLAERTLVGAGRMADGNVDVAQLRANVTSKGGTTEAAIAHLESHGVRQLFAAALKAAAERSRQLGTQPSTSDTRH
ncbi:MAG TPA: pyrroline-5-carboxylate reductase [Verrucomicrobiae bacterium]|nr:pyrroline-5-carboxylate reductase [Verrucomicrobiae bacterium]